MATSTNIDGPQHQIGIRRNNCSQISFSHSGLAKVFRQHKVKLKHENCVENDIQNITKDLGEQDFLGIGHYALRPKQPTATVSNDRRRSDCIELYWLGIAINLLFEDQEEK